MFELFQSCSVSQLSFKFDVLSNGLDVEPMRQGLMPVLRTLPAGQQGQDVWCHPGLYLT